MLAACIFLILFNYANFVSRESLQDEEEESVTRTCILPDFFLFRVFRILLRNGRDGNRGRPGVEIRLFVALPLPDERSFEALPFFLSVYNSDQSCTAGRSRLPIGG